MDKVYDSYYFDQIGKPSEAMKEFVQKDVFCDAEFVFFNKDKTYCSYCGTESELVDNLKHNEIVTCPDCGRKVIAKNLKYGRKTLATEKTLYYFEKQDNETIICKGYYIKKTYEEYKNPITKYELMALYEFKKYSSRMWKKNWWAGFHETASIYDFNNNWLAKYMCHCSWDSLEESVKGTWLQYFPLEHYIQTRSIVKVIEKAVKYPWLEQIYKVGLVKIVDEYVAGENMWNCLNRKGENIFKILKINRNGLKELRTINELTPKMLRIYQMQLKDNSKLSIEEIEKLENNVFYDFGKFIFLNKYISTRQILSYIQKQRARNKNIGDVVITWADYIKDCIKLNYNLKEKNILFPKDVQVAHQNTIKQVRYQEDKELNKKIKKLAKKREIFKFEYKDLIIRPALDSIELIEEGQKLSHCVGGYAERYAKGNTNILFIRCKNKLDSPYYTVEISTSYKVVQVHGKHNISANKEVKEFMEVYQKEVLEKISKKNKKVA